MTAAVYTGYHGVEQTGAIGRVCDVMASSRESITPVFSASHLSRNRRQSKGQRGQLLDETRSDRRFHCYVVSLSAMALGPHLGAIPLAGPFHQESYFCFPLRHPCAKLTNCVKSWECGSPALSLASPPASRCFGNAIGLEFVPFILHRWL